MTNLSIKRPIANMGYMTMRGPVLRMPVVCKVEHLCFRILLVRFFRGQVANDWNQIYSEIISCMPTKLLDFRKMISWIVADKVETIDGKPWNRKSQQFIRTGGEYIPVFYPNLKT